MVSVTAGFTMSAAMACGGVERMALSAGCPGSSVGSLAQYDSVIRGDWPLVPFVAAAGQEGFSMSAARPYLQAAAWAVVVVLLVLLLLRVDHVGRQVAYICQQVGGIGYEPVWDGFAVGQGEPGEWRFWRSARVCG
ncbi:MAG TPA: hypothetical protein VLM76_02015 [Patescibacteria group bacterium]|nr:hypothetical protein [Patescibacteria group bacterium]